MNVIHILKHSIIAMHHPFGIFGDIHIVTPCFVIPLWIQDNQPWPNQPQPMGAETRKVPVRYLLLKSSRAPSWLPISFVLSQQPSHSGYRVLGILREAPIWIVEKNIKKMISHKKSKEKQALIIRVTRERPAVLSTWCDTMRYSAFFWSLSLQLPLSYPNLILCGWADKWRLGGWIPNLLYVIS